MAGLIRLSNEEEEEPRPPPLHSLNSSINRCCRACNNCSSPQHKSFSGFKQCCVDVPATLSDEDSSRLTVAALTSGVPWKEEGTWRRVGSPRRSNKRSWGEVGCLEVC